MPDCFAIAQVCPFVWEGEHEVTSYVRRSSAELARRGHRVLVLTPSREPNLVRESRRLIREAKARPEALFDPDGGVRVLGVGELLPLTNARRVTAPSPPVDIARTIEEALLHAQLDVVHVHEPFAPSAGSVALRHSRALNVGTFHAPTERVLSTQVARRFVELFFGRLDARVATFAATADLIGRYFPGTYRIVPPGADTPARAPRSDEDVHIVFCDLEDRAALRLALRALRRLPDELAWRATIYSPAGAVPTGALRRGIRDRVHVVSGSEGDVLAEADVVLAASVGAFPAPALLVRALGAGAVPLAARLPAYEEVLDEGALGLHFEPGDIETCAAQLERLVRDRTLRASLADHAAARQHERSWQTVAEAHEAIYGELAARRHATDGKPAVRARLARRELIDVDLHMHTDHSHDCATPVDVLLATARDQGLGAIAVTDHNEVSGALEAAAKAHEYGVKVVVGEEVKTAHQGEVIGLFLREKIPRGMSLEETIEAIRAQNGVVYVPHPFDRLHSVPDYEHLLNVVDRIDAIEIFNPRVAISAFNDEAVRFAAKYRIVAGAGSDAHVAQGLGSVRIRMRDFDGPDEFLESLRDADIIRRPSSLLYVQALKFLQTKATPEPARRASRRRRVRRAMATRDQS